MAASAVAASKRAYVDLTEEPIDLTKDDDGASAAKKQRTMPRFADLYTCETRPFADGGYGALYKGVEKATGKQVAVKVNKVGTKAQYDEHVNEATFLFGLKKYAPYIPTFHGFYKTGENHLSIVMDLLQKDLEKALEQGMRFNIQQLKHLAYSLLIHLECFDEAGVVNCDLKPSNLTVEAGDVYTCCDLGGMKTADDLEEPGVKLCITRDYAAPEVFEKGPYSPAIDMWSVGVILYQIALGLNQSPFHASSLFGDKEKQYLRNIQIVRDPVAFKKHVLEGMKKNPHLQGMPEEQEAVADLIVWMLRLDPKMRPTPTQARLARCFLGCRYLEFVNTTEKVKKLSVSIADANTKLPLYDIPNLAATRRVHQLIPSLGDEYIFVIAQDNDVLQISKRISDDTRICFVDGAVVMTPIFQLARPARPPATPEPAPPPEREKLKALKSDKDELFLASAVS